MKKQTKTPLKFENKVLFVFKENKPRNQREQDTTTMTLTHPTNTTGPGMSYLNLRGM